MCRLAGSGRMSDTRTKLGFCLSPEPFRAAPGSARRFRSRASARRRLTGDWPAIRETRAAQARRRAARARVARAQESGGHGVSARPVRAPGRDCVFGSQPARRGAGGAGARGSIRDAASRAAEPSLNYPDEFWQRGETLLLTGTTRRARGRRRRARAAPAKPDARARESSGYGVAAWLLARVASTARSACSRATGTPSGGKKAGRAGLDRAPESAPRCRSRGIVLAPGPRDANAGGAGAKARRPGLPLRANFLTPS
jgi:hypothetical protein